MKTPQPGADLGVNLPPVKYRPSPNRSPRYGTRIDTVVTHSTQGAYEGAVNWLCDPRAQASAHGVLREDGGEFTQLVPWGAKAWHCAADNPHTIGIELAGYSGSFSMKQMRAAARIVAYLLRRHYLQPRWSTKGGTYGGFCRHSDLGVAGGGHTDPLPDTTADAGEKAEERLALSYKPTKMKLRHWLVFVALVKHEFRRGGFRARWGEE